MNFLFCRLRFVLSHMKPIIKTVAAMFFCFALMWLVYSVVTTAWCGEPRCEEKSSKYDQDLVTFFTRNASDVTAARAKEYGSYAINPSSLCNTSDLKNKSVFLVIFVTSAPADFETRNVIRYSWGLHVHRAHVPLRLVFVTGRTSSEIVQDRLRRESLVKGDVIQANFVDSYRNLTLKTMSLLHWTARHCSGTHYVMKVDSDVIVHLPNLISVLRRFSRRRRIIIGVISSKETPHRDETSKWYVDRQLYPFSYLPVYAHGPSYVISRDLVPVLLRRCNSLKPLWLEDVFVTGICSQGADVTFVGSCGFRIGKMSSEAWGCCSLAVTSHGYSSRNMRTLWSSMNEGGLLGF